MLLHFIFIHLIQGIHSQFDILDQRIASTPRKVFPNDNTHELQFLAVGRHRIRWYHPAPLPELMCNGELIIVMTLGRIQSKCYEWESLPARLTHEDETELFETGGEIVRGAGQVGHDRAVTILPETDHLVVLSNDLGGTLGEVEGERRLVCAKVIDVEDQFLRQVFRRTPNHPANTGIDLRMVRYLVNFSCREHCLPGHICDLRH